MIIGMITGVIIFPLGIFFGGGLVKAGIDIGGEK